MRAMAGSITVFQGVVVSRNGSPGLLFPDNTASQFRSPRRRPHQHGGAVWRRGGGLYAQRLFPYERNSMTVKNCICAALSVLLLYAFSINSVDALSSLQDGFVETSKEEVAAIAPNIVATYPHARFLVSGLSSPFGEWRFVRVEDASSCENELCPTIIIQKEIDWKILVMARKEIETSAGIEGGGLR